mgnify:CR=1 FL=1
MLTSLRTRYLELKKTGINQRTPLSRMAYNTKRLAPNFVQMLQRNKGNAHADLSHGPYAVSVATPKLS